MVNSTTVTTTHIGSTTYTVEREFYVDAKENALQAIKRLLLQTARSDRHELAADNNRKSLDVLINQR